MQRYIKSLDGIRGLGIIFVVTAHFFGADVAYDWISFSWIFVQMFFVQSGYLITKILLEDRERPLGEYLKRFYWRRALRIFPIYFAYLFVFVALYLATHKPADFPERAPFLFTYTYNWARFIPDFGRHDTYFGPFWSLALEEQFYFIWPFIIYFVRGRNLKLLIPIIMILGPIFRFTLANVLLATGYKTQMVALITYTNTFSQFDAFAYGAAIPIFGLTETVKQPRKWAGIVVGASVLIGLTNWALQRMGGWDTPITSVGYAVAHMGNYQYVWSYSVVDAVFTFVIIYLVSPQYRGLFNNRVLISIGKIVYGLYILHSVVIVLVHRVNDRFIHNQWVAYAIALALSWLVAHLSYYHFEKRFLDLKDFWVKRKTRAHEA